MSKVKAMCPKCNAEFEVDNGDDAGICPQCGAAFVTEKAIKYYSECAAVQSGFSSEFEEISTLADNYFAFVALYDTDYESLLELYRLRAKIREQVDTLNDSIDKHNKLVDKEEIWRNRFNSRAQGYNDKGYSLYEDSLSKKAHRRYVESALNRHNAVEDKINDSRAGVEKQQSNLEELIAENRQLSDKVYDEILEYNRQALALAKYMCERYPSNPLGYLVLADWNMREVESGEKVLKYVGERYSADNYVTLEAEADVKIDVMEKNACDEAKKAEKLMTDEFRAEYADIIKKLKKAPKTATRRAPASKPAPSRASSKGASSKVKVKRAHSASSLNWVASCLCCIPIIAVLIFVFIIPYIGALNSISYVSCFGWQALSLPMKVSFLSVVIIGIGVQVLGLFDKLGNVIAMITQIFTFLIFALCVYAAQKNTGSVYMLWGLALAAPISLVVAALRYMSEDSFGFLDNFGFWHYLPIALEVAEYALFALVFPLMFGQSASMWMFIALSVTTVGAIAVSSFWEDLRWFVVGVNLVVAALLCLINWLGIVFASEWMSNGGVILVVILAIGGSIFGHWFIHRNDP